MIDVVFCRGRDGRPARRVLAKNPDAKSQTLPAKIVNCKAGRSEVECVTVVYSGLRPPADAGVNPLVTRTSRDFFLVSFGG